MQTNNLHDSIKSMMQGLNGMMQTVQDVVDTSMKDLNPEDAKKVAEQMDVQDVQGKLKEARDKIEALNRLYAR